MSRFSYSLIEIPFLVLAVVLGLRAIRRYADGLHRTGLAFVVSGLVIMAVGHLHMLVEALSGLNVFEKAFGGIGGSAAWVLALIASWMLSAHGFRKIGQGSMQDSLTGIGNRLRFETALGRELKRASRSRVGVALLLVDIDLFKAFNDHYGHRAGDRCLHQVAQCLKGVARRATDVVCRYGGEEFAILVSNVKPEDVESFAELLRRSVEELDIEHEKSRFGSVTISVGGTYATADANGEAPCPEEVVRAADAALYRAKENGRNQTRLALDASLSDREGPMARTRCWKRDTDVAPPVRTDRADPGAMAPTSEPEPPAWRGAREGRPTPRRDRTEQGTPEHQRE